MTILRIYIAVLLLLCSLAGGAQVRPDQFPLQTNIGGFNFEIYSQYGGINTKSTPYYMKLYYAPNIDSAWQAFTFTDSIGVADSLRMQFIKDNRGRVWYTDADGDALLLKDTAQAVGNVYVLPTTADTSSVASPVEGDIAIVGSDTLLFYETYWLMFAGGAGGIYGGSGTVPASTWAELLGSLIFDIDSLGSFTVGDIDEKSTGAFISVSNSGGNDGQITLRSGSGGGYTDATVQINNYQLPGNTPTAEGLPSGDYFWIVSQAGVRKGQDSTGWIHIDSLLSGYPTGSGTAGTLPIWTGVNTLGNSSLTEGSGVLSTSLTGAFGLAVGTDAQQPVGANGRIRYSTTGNGVQAWNGATSSYLYLPWADADNWAAGYVPFMNSAGTALTSSANLIFASGELIIGGTDNGAFPFQVNGGSIYKLGSSKITFGSDPSILISGAFNGAGAIEITTGDIELNSGGSKYRQISYSSSNTAGMVVENDGAGMAVVFDETSIEKNGAATSDSTGNAALYVGIGDGVNSTQSGRSHLVAYIMGTESASQGGQSNHLKTAGLYNTFRHKRGNLPGSFVEAARYGTYVVNSDSAAYAAKFVVESFENGSLKKSASFYGNKVYIGNSTTPAYTLDVSTGGVRIASQSAAPTLAANVLYVDSDDADIVFSPNGTDWRYIPLSVTQTLENHGTISTSTDGSGDIVVAHGMGTTPTSVQVTVTGTTPYVVTVHSIDATNLTIRFFDMTGAAVASTAVTATWHCKT